MFDHLKMPKFRRIVHSKKLDFPLKII